MSKRDDDKRIWREVWEDTPTWAKVILIGTPIYTAIIVVVCVGYIIHRGTLFP